MNIATIILTYNEQEKIGSFLRGLPKYCDPILLDDSTDNTRAIALESGAQVITIPELPRGFLGVKYISALKYASDLGYKYAVTTDAGDNFDPRWIDYLLMAADDADMVIAQRKFLEVTPRRVNSNIASFAMSLLGPRLSDATCGLRLYNLASIDFNTIAETAHAFQMEMLVRMHHKGCRINTTTIPYRSPTTSTLKANTYADWFRVYLALWREYNAPHFCRSVSIRSQVRPVRELLEVDSRSGL